jgi:hypothetical protein
MAAMVQNLGSRIQFTMDAGGACSGDNHPIDAAKTDCGHR